MLFRECYALEKIHGTSAHISFKYNYGPISLDESYNNPVGWEAKFFSGESHEKFVSLFDVPKLLAAVKDLGIPIDKTITVFGEAYGGKCQGMSKTYGPSLKFIVFDVQVDDNWLDVPNAEDVAKKLSLEFVYYTKCSLVKLGYAPEHKGFEDVHGLSIVETNLSEIDRERDADSVQAVRNGMGTGHKREGVILRPLVEMKLNDGSRVIVKHKGDAFKETATPRPVVDPSKLKVLEEANAIANDWVTQTRLEHVLQKLTLTDNNPMADIPVIIKAMTEDVLREASGEIVVSDAAKKAIGKKAVELFKATLTNSVK